MLFYIITCYFINFGRDISQGRVMALLILTLKVLVTTIDALGHFETE